MVSNAGSNTNIDVDVMPEMSTYGTHDSNCMVDDDINSLPSESASHDSGSMVNHTQ